MPYIPRFISPSTPDFGSVPRAPSRTSLEKPTVPYTKPEPSTGRKSSSLIGRLSMMKFDVPAAKIYKHITDKELNIDEYSKLVSPKRPSS
jgi:hypothetical protein